MWKSVSTYQYILFNVSIYFFQCIQNIDTFNRCIDTFNNNPTVWTHERGPTALQILNEKLIEYRNLGQYRTPFSHTNNLTVVLLVEMFPTSFLKIKWRDGSSCRYITDGVCMSKYFSIPGSIFQTGEKREKNKMKESCWITRWRWFVWQ